MAKELYTVLTVITEIIGFVLTLSTLKAVFASREYIRHNMLPSIFVYCGNVVLIMVALPLIIISVWIENQKISTILSCDISLPIFIMYLHLVSICHVSAYFQMFIGVYFPFQYQTLRVRRILSAITVLCVLMVVLIDLLPFIYHDRSDVPYCHYYATLWWIVITMALYAFLPIPFIMVIIIYLIKTAARHELKVLKLNKELENNNKEDVNESNNNKKPPCNYCYVLTLKATKDSFLFLLLHFICLSPLIVYLLVFAADGTPIQCLTDMKENDIAKVVVLCFLQMTPSFTGAYYFVRRNAVWTNILRIFISCSVKEIKKLAKIKQKGECVCKCYRNKKEDPPVIEGRASSIFTITDTFDSVCST